MLLAGADKICFVISPGKSDIMHYFDAGIGAADMMYVVQSRPSGLCDAVFRPLSFIDPLETVLIGLPDTVWFPEDGFAQLPDDRLSFLLFPSERPELFDAVCVDSQGRVLEIQSKQPDASSNWIWGAFRMPASTLTELYELWLRRDRQDVYFGPLINAYLAEGGAASALKVGSAYVDVGTLNGYRAAIRLLSGENRNRLPDPGV